MLTAVVGLPTTPSAFAVETSGYDASPYAYDAPARLSSPDTVATYLGVAPTGPGAGLWASPVAIRDRGVAANTAATSERISSPLWTATKSDGPCPKFLDTLVGDYAARSRVAARVFS